MSKGDTSIFKMMVDLVAKIRNQATSLSKFVVEHSQVE